MTPERRLKILTGTRAAIADPRRWGQGTFVQHPLLDRLMMRPPSLCLMAAVSVVASGAQPGVAEGVMWNAEVAEVHEFLKGLVPPADLQGSAYGLGMMTWNDQHTHAEVIALLDQAISVTWLEVKGWHRSDAAAQDHEHESNDRQDDQDGPQHDGTDTHTRGHAHNPPA